MKILLAIIIIALQFCAYSVGIQFRQSHEIAQNASQSILSFVYGNEYCDCITPIDGGGNKSSQTSYVYSNDDMAKALGFSINIKPNPAKVYASVDYTSITPEQIVAEKGWEMAGEYSRWFDLQRLQMLDEVIAKKHPDDLQPLGTPKYYLPIPVSETQVNKNLLGGN